MGQPSFYHATVALSFQIEICNLDKTKSSFLATSLYKNVIFTKNWVTRSCHPSDEYKLLKKVLQFKFDWSYLSYYHIFFIIIGIKFWQITPFPLIPYLWWLWNRGKHTTAGFEWESEIKSCKALCAAYCSESLGDENNGIFPAAQH